MRFDIVPYIGAFLAASVLTPGSEALAATDTLDTRVAAVSGIHPPHQGFAFAAEVPSDEACVALGQNLASEIGITTYVVCSVAATGEITAVAECGFTADPTGGAVRNYLSPGFLGRGAEFLVCVRPAARRFSAERIAPNLDELRP